MQHGMLSARRRPRRSQPKGFTLVELMITVSIIAILVGAAIGGIYNYRSERVGLEAARQIAERLRGLHRMAIASNRAVVLRINEGAAGALSDNGARGRIEVLISSDNTCANVGAVDNNATMDLQFNAANPTAFSQRFRVENVQIVTVSPHTTGDFDLV
ncbi:MAG: prepilin-type N-terminal cleavage/methylation domain-containing protein, partial [Myxococcota bacterium]